MRAKPSVPSAAVGVARQLAHHLARRIRHLGMGRGLRQAGRVLRRVVVELVSGDDLARPVHAERRLGADDRDLEIAGSFDVPLDDREVVVAEGEVEGRRTLGGRMGERHPDR